MVLAALALEGGREIPPMFAEEPSPSWIGWSLSYVEYLEGSYSPPDTKRDFAA